MATLTSFLDPNFKSEINSKTNLLLLSNETQQHIKSHRLRPGERIQILNGKGEIWTLTKIDTQDNFTCISHTQKPQIQPQIELCISPPVGDALAQAIQQSTEIGATSFRFFRSEFNQYKRGTEPNFKRLQRVADSACAQCARAWNAQIYEDFESLEHLLLNSNMTLNFYAEENLGTYTTHFNNIEKLQDKLIRIFIGPEGGWGEHDRHLLKSHNVIPMGLGSQILRVPTACVAAIFNIFQLASKS